MEHLFKLEKSKVLVPGSKYSTQKSSCNTSKEIRFLKFIIQEHLLMARLQLFVSDDLEVV